MSDSESGAALPIGGAGPGFRWRSIRATFTLFATPQRGARTQRDPHEFRFHRRAEAVRRRRAQVRGGQPRERVRSRVPTIRGFPFDVAALMSRQGLLGITIPEADGGQGGTLMDAVIAIEQVALACPRSADVVQSGSFGPIRTFAEYAAPALKAKYLPALLAGRAVMSLGMSEPRGRLRGDRPRHHGADRRRPRRHQRHQGVLDLQRRRRRVPDLCAVRPGRARHRLGDRRARHARASASARRRAS